MDTPTRHSVSSLVHERHAGLITSGEFFERLSDLNFVGLDPTVPSASPWASEASPAVLTGPEAEALLRQPAKERAANGRPPPTSSPVLHSSATATAGHWPREEAADASWGNVSGIDAMGMPALLTEKQATLLAQELSGPSSTGYPASPMSFDADLHSLLPMWTASPITPFPASATSGERATLMRSLSTDLLSARSCSSHGSAFSQRNEHWDHQRTRRREELQRQQNARELAECSFRPTVRTTASRASGSTGCTGDTPARARFGAPPPAARFNQAARRWKEDREVEEMRECTFAPDISRSSSSRHLTARSLSHSLLSTDPAASWGPPGGGYHQVEEGTNMRRSPSANSSSTPKGGRSRSKDAAPNCTFSPSTNHIPAHMACANTYARQNVFSRLSQPQQGGGGTVDQEAFASADADAPSTKAQHSSRGPSQVSAHSQCTSDPLQYDESFLNFLQRQNDFEEDRRLRLSEVERFTAPSLQPALCPQSRKLARQRSARKVQQQRSPGGQSPCAGRSGSPGAAELELRTGITAKGCLSGRGPMPVAVLWGIADSGTGGTSSARVGSTSALTTSRRSGAEECEATAQSPNLSFQPSITASASRRPARSLSELSRGDAMRREAKVHQKRLEQRSEADKELIFKPQLIAAPSALAVNPAVKSKLRLLEDPDSYLERIAGARHDKELKCQEASEERAAQELAACTFSPQVQKGAPDFVRQMAETYRLARSLAVAEKAKSPRPGWQ